MSEKIKDSWMNPDRFGRAIYSRTDPLPYVIERMKAPTICSWVGSPPRPSWKTWAEFATAEERDVELARLRKTTEWRLRPARRMIIGGQVYDSQIEDEEADLRYRLAMLEMQKKNPA